MTCAEVERLVALSALDALEDDERQRFEAHTAICAGCARAHAGLVTALAPLNESFAGPASESSWEAIVARLDAAAADDAPPARPPARLAPIALACIYCHGGLPRADACFCASCLAPHHGDCFRAHGRCAAPGCEEMLTVRPGQVRMRRRAGGGEPPRRWRSTTAVLAVLAGGAVAAAALVAIEPWRSAAPAASGQATPAPVASPGVLPSLPEVTATCARCGNATDPTVPALVLSSPARLGFCSEEHRDLELQAFAAAERERQPALEARVVAVLLSGRVQLDHGLRHGVLAGDLFAVWREGALVARLRVTEVHEGAAFGVVDLTLPQVRLQRGDRAIRNNDAVAWSRVEAVRLGQQVQARLLAALQVPTPRVLYLESYARTEFQHLARVLTEHMVAHTLLLSADDGWAHPTTPGLEPLAKPPTSLDAWDVLVLGDVPADVVAGLDLAGFVRRGGGLLLLPGAEGVKALGAPVVDLSPVADVPTTREGPEPIEGEFVFGALLPGAGELLGHRLLPPLLSVRHGRVRPDARVTLADDQGRPVVVAWTLPAGGRVVHVAADDLWRWRRVRGEEPYTVLWLELLGWAAGRLERDPK